MRCPHAPLQAKVLLALWTFPGNWVTYYSNSFRGGCSMAKNFAPEKWRRVSLLLFGHENAECPFPPVRKRGNRVPACTSPRVIFATPRFPDQSGRQ